MTKKKRGRHGVNAALVAGMAHPCLAALLAAAALPAAADDEELYFSSLPIVATVSRLPQALSDAPGSVTVIDREMIRASGARNISDLLRLVPGFQVSPPNTDAPRVTYHGVSNEDFSPRVQVLIDGRSQYSPLFRGGVNWNTLPVALEDIARIEVLRGSNSAAYGSNAFLGVVNIVTLDASQTRGFTAVSNYGTQGVRDEFIRLGGHVGNADFRVSVKQQADDGYFFRQTDPRKPLADIADGFRQRQFDFRSDLALSERDQLQISFGGLENRLDTGRADVVLDPPRKLDQTNGYFSADWRRSLDGGGEIGLRYFHSEESTSDRYRALYQIEVPDALKALLGKSTLSLPFYFDRDGHSTRDDLEFQHILKPAETMRLVWGAGGRLDSVRQPIVYFGHDTIRRSTYRLFGNLEWRLLPSLLANIGGSWERDSFGGTTFAPRLNLNYRATPEQTLRAGVSRAFRSPAAFDIQGDIRLIPEAPVVLPGNIVLPLSDRMFLASPGLKPERIDSFDIGYLGDFRDYRSTLDIRAFVERISDRIVTAQRALTPPNCEFNPENPGCGYADYAFNGQKILIRGVEYQWRWQPLEATRLLFNQAYIRIGQSQSPDLAAQAATSETIERQTVASAPLVTTSAMLMQKLPYGIEFSAIHHWVGTMRWTANSLVPAYRRLDLRLAYPFRLGSSNAELAFVSQSANGDHAEFKETRIVKERHWISLRLEL